MCVFFGWASLLHDSAICCSAFSAFSIVSRLIDVTAAQTVCAEPYHHLYVRTAQECHQRPNYRVVAGSTNTTASCPVYCNMCTTTPAPTTPAPTAVPTVVPTTLPTFAPTNLPPTTLPTTLEPTMVVASSDGGGDNGMTVFGVRSVAATCLCLFRSALYTPLVHRYHKHHS